MIEPGNAAKPKKKSRRWLLWGFGLLLCLCAAGAVAILGPKQGTPEAVAPSAQSTTMPTTPPSNTPGPTSTPAPTETPLPPLTLTAQSRIASQTAVAANATATQQSRLADMTATADAKAAQATDIAQYKPIYWKDLVTYPDAHAGELVSVRGRIFNVVSDQELQIWLAGTNEAVYVVMASPYSDLYKDDVIAVYGMVEGKRCGSNAFGGQVCQPSLIDAFYTK
jgi:hypothetical protein